MGVQCGGGGEGWAFVGGAFFTHGGRLALGCMAGQLLGLGIGELGDDTADGEPYSAADCGSAIDVADGSGATVTVVVVEELSRLWATGSPGGGAAIGLDCAKAPGAASVAASAIAIMGLGIVGLLPVEGLNEALRLDKSTLGLLIRCGCKH